MEYAHREIFSTLRNSTWNYLPTRLSGSICFRALFEALAGELFAAGELIAASCWLTKRCWSQTHCVHKIGSASLESHMRPLGDASLERPKWEPSNPKDNPNESLVTQREYSRKPYRVTRPWSYLSGPSISVRKARALHTRICTLKTETTAFQCVLVPCFVMAPRELQTMVGYKRQP